MTTRGHRRKGAPTVHVRVDAGYAAHLLQRARMLGISVPALTRRLHKTAIARHQKGVTR